MLTNKRHYLLNSLYLMKHSTNLMMKFFGLFVAVMAFSLNAIAGNKVSIEDFTIVPGEEKTIAVVLENSDPISSLQMDVTFPKGLEYVNKSVSKNADRLKIHSIGAPTLASKATRFIILHEAEDITKSAFVGNTGAIFTFKVKASAAYKGGKIEVTNVEGSNGTLAEPVAVEMESFSVKANAFAGTFSLSAETISMNLQEGNSAQVDVTLANAFSIAGVQADIVLPENLIVEEIIKGARVPENYNPKPSSLETSGTVTLSSLIVEDFEGNDGVVFSLKLKAIGEVKGQLVVKNMIATEKSGATAFEIDGEETVDVDFFYVYYNVNIAENVENGTVTADKEKAISGETVALTVTPNENFAIESVSVTYGEENTPVEVTEDFQFVMPAGDVNISVVFKDMTDPNKPVAPELTATSPLVTDGSVAQYLYNVEAKAFLVGANDWGTRASFSATTAYPVKMTLNEDGATYTFADQLPNGNWNSLDCSAVDQIWVDGAGRGGDKMWTVTIAEDGSFTIANNNVPNGNLSVVPSKNDTRLYISDAEEAQDVWVALSEEDYKAYIEAYNKYLAELDAYNKQNYGVGAELASLAPATWEGQSGNYGGLADPAAERYNGGGSVEAGDVLTQTIENLKNGTYQVTLGLAASYTSGRGFECPTGDGLSVGFANEAEANLTVVDRGWVGEGEQTIVTLTASVVDGTLKYGIKNLAPSGNWYVANVRSIIYVSDQIYSDLAVEDYFRWTAADATGTQERVEPTALTLGTSTGLVYGDGNVYYLNYADLSDVKTLVAVATEGEPRFLFNRIVDNGDVQAELPRDAAKYETVVENADGSKTYTIDVAAIVAEFGYAHLHAIKGANWANTTVTSLKVGKVVKPIKNYSIDIERYAGMGYTASTATVDFADALAFLGVEALTTDMLSIVNPDGTEVSDYAPYDGWFAADGAAMSWGDNSKVCVKFFQALSSGQFEICDMNGADEIGKTYTVKFALKANDKTAIYTINVKFVEKPVLALTYADLTNKKDVAVEFTSELGKCYEGLTADVDVASILAELGAESLNDVTVYAVQSDGTLDDNYKLGTTDGWRNAAGDWQSWGDAAYFYVKADFAKASAQIYEVGGMQGKNTTEPATYTATYAFVNANAEAVTLKVTLTYPAAEEPEIGTVIHTIDFTTQESYPYYVMTAPEGSSFDVIDGALVIENTVEQANFWDLQPFICDWFSLKAGYDYIVRITMKSDTDGSATIGMGTWSASMSKQLDFTASTEYQKYNVEFPASTVESANNDVHVLFQAGKFIGKVEIAKVEIIEIVPVGIETPETAAPAAKKSGKFLENGKIVIIKNGQKYSTSGSIIK